MFQKIDWGTLTILKAPTEAIKNEGSNGNKKLDFWGKVSKDKIEIWILRKRAQSSKCISDI